MDQLAPLYEERVLGAAFQRYVSLSNVLGGVVKEQAEFVHHAFLAQKSFIALAAKHKKPTDIVIQSLLKPTVDNLLAAQALREQNRNSEFFNHLSAVSEALTALGWVIVSPDPSKHAKELHGAGAYFGHKVIVAHKDKNTKHADWANAWLQAILDLHAYIFDNHRTGLQWNMRGPTATEKSLGADSSPTAAGGPPLPPPPPPPFEYIAPLTQVDQGNESRAALLQQINKGLDITKSLKKVDIHSPPTSSQVKPRLAASKPTASSDSSIGTKNVPKMELDGRKWCVEYQVGKQMKISETRMNECVVMYKCVNSNLQVSNKVNAITLDSCKKTTVVFNDIVSYVEFINCQDMKAQAVGNVPTITADKTDGLQIFLSDGSLNVDVVSSKSSEINICVPTADGDFREFPVPEQFKTTIKNKESGLKTVIIEKV